MAADITEICYIDFHGDFDTQVRNILTAVRLTRDEVEDLNRLFEDLEQALRSFWPGCIVMPFGSIVTGLGIKTSDADCYISLPEYLKNSGENYVMTAKHVLRRRPHIFQQLFAITAAKVPIVKFFHAPTQCHCDVNFKSPSGVQNSRLMAFLLQMDERAMPLAVILKYWSKVHKLTGTNLVPNYALSMMIIFFLQKEDILPSVYELQRNVQPYMIDNWNTAFNSSYFHSSNNLKTVYELLKEFFTFYSTYQYADNVISPYIGYSLSKNMFKSLDLLPDEFPLYKNNVRRRQCKILQINTPMCVQDPFELSRNGAVGVYPKMFAKFLAHIQHAVEMFNCYSPKDVLKQILDPRNAPQLPEIPVPPQTKNNPMRVIKPHKVTKAKHRMNVNKNVNLHTLYTHANRMRRQMRAKQRLYSAIIKF